MKIPILTTCCVLSLTIWVPVRFNAPVPNRLRPLLAGLSLVLLVAITYSSIPDLAMLGWDGWPLIAASRIESVGDFFGTFAEPLMAGRYPHGDFYRPVTHLCFAIDEWIGGLEVAGYHRTDLGLVAACSLCLAALVTRLAGGWAGLLAGVMFVLHPVQLEVLAVPARRADTLALLFGLGCLLSQADAPRMSRRLATAALAALAAGSKETGFWIAPAVIGWHWLHNGRRLVPALSASAPTLVGVGLCLVGRVVVLGGLGGHTGHVSQAVSKVQLWGGLTSGTLYPEPVFGVFGPLGLTVLGAALLASVLLVWRLEARTLGVAIVMACSLLAVTSLADRLHAWYAFLFSAPLAIATSVTAVRGVGLFREGDRARGLVAAGLPLALLVSFILGSPLVQPYPRLEAASRWLSSSYDLVERELEGSAPGDVLQLDSWPVGVSPLPDGRDVQSLALAREYTLQAYLELHHPSLATDVQLFDGRNRATAREGHLVIELIPGAPPPSLEEASPGRQP